MKERPTLDRSVLELRKWQRHWLLRQFADNGQVLPENLALSEYLDVVIAAAEPARDEASKR